MLRCQEAVVLTMLVPHTPCAALRGNSAKGLSREVFSPNVYELAKGVDISLFSCYIFSTC